MTGHANLNLALRLLRRDLASGRLMVMLFAAVIAVASSVSVNLLVTRVKAAMTAESSALLAADLVVISKDPVPPTYIERATAAGLTLANTVSMRSVISHAEQLQLVRLKAVSDAYPLRGVMRIADAPFTGSSIAHSGPPAGEVWADLRLFQLLELEVGDTLTVGSIDLRVGKLLVMEPDRGGDLFSIAPRLMMHGDDLARSGLIVPGSRATYNLLAAGTAPQIEDFESGLSLQPGHRVLKPTDARPEMRNAFVQAERFLTLASYAGVLLATIGIALAASAYSEHHKSTVAIFKTLGLAARDIRQVLTIELAALAVAATLLGDLIALAVHEILIARYMQGAELGIVAVPAVPLIQGAWVALAILAGFGLPALFRAVQLPVTAILNRDQAGLEPARPRTLLIMLLAVAAVAPWYLGNPRLVALTFAGMIVSALAAGIVGLVLVNFLSRLRSRTALGWRFGLANIARRARLSVLQVAALGLGIAVILLLGLVRDDLMGQWRDRIPDGTPNQFLINVHADEVAAMRRFLRERLAGDVGFYPMVRGRLRRINDGVVDPDAYVDPRARRLADREFNLSWATDPKPDNRITAGSWWRGPDGAEMSVEQGLAETLGIELGDKLEFLVADRTVSGTVTSLRAVQWDNFEVNFFVVTTPPLLEGAPATWITSFYLPPTASKVMPELVRRFPSVTVIDVDALMQQVRRVMDRVSGALSWVFGFALVAGVLVLAASVQASQRERLLDVVLLKTLGAERGFVSSMMLAEFILLGLLAGIIGAAGAVFTGWAVAEYALRMSYTPDPLIPLFGIAAGVVGVTLLGMAATWNAHRHSVLQGLRDAA